MEVFPFAQHDGKGVESSYALLCAMAGARSALAREHLREHAHPVAVQDLRDLRVAEAARDQLAGQVAGVAVVRQVGQEVRLGQPPVQLGALGRRPAPVDELEEVEPDPHPVDSS